MLRDPLESMEFQHVLTLEREFPQIAEEPVGLLARQQLFGGIIQFTVRGQLRG